MSGQHARKPPMPFWALIGAIVLVAGGMMVASAMTDDQGAAGGSPSSGSPSPGGVDKALASPSSN